MHVNSIETVSVHASKSQKIIPGQVLAGGELRRLGAQNVADAIRYFAGVQIKDYGGVGGLKTINIRSMGSQHVGVFYDGIAIGNAQNGTVDLGRFSLDNMEAVELHNGQRSDLFQSARDFASSSAIYMTSRRPEFSGGKSQNITLRAKTGSFDLANLSALWERRLSGKYTVAANVEALNTSGRYRFTHSKTGAWSTTETRTNGDLWFVRAEAAVFRRADDSEFQLKGYLYTSHRGYPGSTDKDTFRNSRDRQRDRNVFVQSSWRRTLGSRHSLRLQAKASHDYMRFIRPITDATTIVAADDRFRQTELYASASNLVSIRPWWTINAAIDLQWNRLEATAQGTMFNERFPRPRRLSVLSAAATSANFERWSAQISLLHTYVHDSSARGMAVADDRSIFSPTATAVWRPTSNLDLRGFYKRIFRMPTFNDLYYVEIGRRTLRPEFTSQFNLGATWRGTIARGASVEISADAYYNKVRDKIVAVPTVNQMSWSMMNIGLVEIRGVDVAVNPRWSIGRALFSTRLTYTFQRAQDMTASVGDQFADTRGDQIPYIPRHSGSAIVGVVWRAWDANYSFIYTGERYNQKGNVAANLALPWYTSDVTLGCTVRRWRFGVEVNNVFNQQYEVVQWYPMPGTNVKLIITATL